jgi:transposase
MIPAGVQVFVALEPIDLRYGFERLAGLVQERMGYEARSGALFVFVGRRRTATKILFFDGTGICLLYKKLDRGTFAWPELPSDGATHVEIDDATLETLLDGIEIAPRSPAVPTPRRPIH